MWALQPTSHVTWRVPIVPICEMGTAIPISKDPGEDVTATRAMKILGELYIPCPDVHKGFHSAFARGTRRWRGRVARRVQN